VSALTTDLKPDEMLVEIETTVAKAAHRLLLHGDRTPARRFCDRGRGGMMTLGEQDECTMSLVVFCGGGRNAASMQVRLPTLLSGACRAKTLSAMSPAIVQTMIEPSGSVHATADYQRHIRGRSYRAAHCNRLRAGA